MIIEILVLVALPALCFAAAAYDLTNFTIPNVLQIALVLGFIGFIVAARLSMPVIGLHLVAGFIGFVLGLVLFALGFIGGGDAKLFAVLALWFGLHDLVAFALVTAIVGGVLTLVILALRRFALPAILMGQPWILRLHDPKGGIPYGVALAGGMVAILPHSEIFRLAAGA